MSNDANDVTPDEIVSNVTQAIQAVLRHLVEKPQRFGVQVVMWERGDPSSRFSWDFAPCTSVELSQAEVLAFNRSHAGALQAQADIDAPARQAAQIKEALELVRAKRCACEGCMSVRLALAWVLGEGEGLPFDKGITKLREALSDPKRKEGMH